ncbi:hypothetical protein HCN44_009708 [Aphidius gifuensis]|uniref:Major facilitator superfamily (MFS) profile domain-containing protein n=1 Tax=Aphidius gifuensis TaxID=684658 RepID=A0A834Y2R6_APHGI|nr:monocarboxylate transporter 12 [Aphidius gifuensis]KAF7998310.1 hypothetical protein HCN44_009708 [Aphidius gifuensis]
MSLPREWSFNKESRTIIDSHNLSNLNNNRENNNFNNYQHITTSQKEFGKNTITSIVDENDMNNKNQLGSLFSIHSAPVYDLNTTSNLPCKPVSLVVQTTANSTPIVPPILPPLSSSSPSSRLSLPPQPSPETNDDEDNDNLLTISSLTARPLIAKSREIRSSRKCKNKKNIKNNKLINKNSTYVPLDGGYGWVVVGGAFFVQFWVAGLVKSYGVLYVEIMETFNDSSAAVASWIPAILSCLCLALAPVTSILCQKYSCRSVVFIGGIFCALGLTISYFATSLVHLFFSFGILTGIGGGLSTTPGIIIVSTYFDKHRALANGICVSGTAAGSFVFPLLIEILVANFGFHGTFLVLGGCMLHVCVSATLYRPLEDNPEAMVINENSIVKKIIINNDDDDDGDDNNDNNENKLLPIKQKKLELLFDNNDKTKRHNLLNELFHQNGTKNIDLIDNEEEKDIMGEELQMKPIQKIRSSSILHSVEDLSTDSTCVYKARPSIKSLKLSSLTVTHPHLMKKSTIQESPIKIKIKRTSIIQIIKRYIDLNLLKDPQFIMMCLSVTLMSTGSPYMLYYLPAYVHACGYTKSEAGYLVAISAVLDLCGRLGLGWLSDLHLFDRRKGYIGSIVAAGIAVLAIPMAQSFYILACSVGIYGLCLGCWFLLVPVLLADQYGTDKISSSYGLVRMFQSIGAISIPPLAGYLRDVTGSYSVCFLCMGTCMILGGLPLLLVSSSPKKSSKVNHPDEDNKDTSK